MSSDPNAKPNRNLSEISHLFLSSIRDRSNQPKPVRKPPGAGNDVPVDSNATDSTSSVARPANLSNEEMALVAEAENTSNSRIPPITGVIGSHLNDRQAAQVKRYARYLAAEGQRVGLIEVDAWEFRLMTFEPGPSPDEESQAIPVTNFDTRAISDAINELNCDVDCWLMVASNPRLPEARKLLANVDRWTLLTTCAHDGIVEAYRSLKGLADLHRPTLSLAMLDARHLSQADQVYRKLFSVCVQFLNWSPEPGEAVIDTPGVSETLIMHCKTGKEKGLPEAGPHWQIISDLLSRARAQSGVVLNSAPVATMPDTSETTTFPEGQLAGPEFGLPPEPVDEAVTETSTEFVVPTPVPTAGPTPDATRRVAPSKPVAQPSMPNMNTFDLSFGAGMATPVADSQTSDVVDLSTTATGEADLLGAIIDRLKSELAECSVRPPMCGEARLAVSRDRRLVLVAVDRSGLSSMRSIAEAYRWINENRQLLAMALPQFAIDPLQLPHLRLFIDQSDINAELLQPMLQSGSVTVRTYRKIRWGAKTGLLLEAA